MKTKRKGKEKKEKKRRKNNRLYPESNSGPSAHQAVSLLLRHVKHIPKFLIIFIKSLFPRIPASAPYIKLIEHY